MMRTIKAETAPNLPPDENAASIGGMFVPGCTRQVRTTGQSGLASGDTHSDPSQRLRGRLSALNKDFVPDPPCQRLVQAVHGLPDSDEEVGFCTAYDHLCFVVNPNDQLAVFVDTARHRADVREARPEDTDPR